MNANVRRLLLDVQPRQIVFCVVVLLEYIVMSYTHSEDHTRLPAPIWMSYPGLIAFLPKLRAWDLLPVPSRTKGQALWWAFLGLPALAEAVVLSGINLVKHGFLNLPTSFNAVVTIWLLHVAINMLWFASGMVVTWAHRRDNWPLLSFVYVIVCAEMLGAVALSWFDLLSPRLDITAGLLSLAGAFCLYQTADRWGAASPALLRGKTNTRKSIDLAPIRPPQSGWAALIPHYLKFRIPALLVVAGGLIALSRDAPQNLVYSFAFPVLLVSGLVSIAANLWAPRVLRSLPLATWTMVAVLQMAAILPQMMLVIFLVAGDWVFLGKPMIHLEIILPSLALTSLASAVLLRFGPIGIRWLMILIMLIIGGSAGFLAASHAVLPYVVDLLIIPLSVIAIATAWSWTHRELTHGPHAYRAAPVALRWR